MEHAVFEYFPTHYSWNMGLLMAAQLGGELTEIDEACRPLQEIAKRPIAKDDPEAQAAWLTQWEKLARKVEAAEAAKYAEEEGVVFMETSAKTGANVNELFLALAKKLPLKKTTTSDSNSNKRTLDAGQRPKDAKKGCC